VTEGDEFREPDAEAEYVAEVSGGELVVYPGSGHLFAEPGHPDYDEEVASLATKRLLAFLANL
jgi:dienelactone hydrolase